MCENLNKNRVKQNIEPDYLSDQGIFPKDLLINEFIKKNCSGDGISLKRFINDFEKEIIIRALNISRGNQRIASFILNINPTTLSEKIKRLDLRKNNKIKDQRDLKYLLSEVNNSLL